MFLVAIPRLSQGRLALVPKNGRGQPLASRAEALDAPRGSTPDLLPPRASVDRESVGTVAGGGAVREIKEWQAIMDFLRGLPSQPGELPAIPVDDRVAEVRAIRAD